MKNLFSFSPGISGQDSVPGYHTVSMGALLSLDQTTSGYLVMRMPLMIVAVATLAACAMTTPNHGSTSRLLYIAGDKVPCTNGIMKTECLQYRETPKQPWQVAYAPIEGLDWKAGNEYLLKITEVHAKSAPADASRVTWHVDKIVEQHPASAPPVP
jgi:hypothetical protein